MESKKIIHIHLKNQEFNGKTEFYFGSVPAVYEVLDERVLGMKSGTMGQYLWHRGGMYENDRCRIIVDSLVRKSNSRTTNKQ